MFTWTHACSIEVDLPLKTLWDFYTDPKNMPLWVENIESCTREGEFKHRSKN